MNGQRPRNGKAQAEIVRRTMKGPHRRHKRFRTQSILIDNPVQGRVVNIGKAGFAVETFEGLAVGESYVFKVRLGDKHLHLTGRVQWCRLTSTDANGEAEDKLPVYKAGIALAETVASKAWQEALARLTEEPAYVIWHRTQRPRSSAETLAQLRVRQPLPR